MGRHRAAKAVRRRTPKVVRRRVMASKARRRVTRKAVRRAPGCARSRNSRSPKSTIPPGATHTRVIAKSCAANMQRSKVVRAARRLKAPTVLRKAANTRARLKVVRIRVLHPDSSKATTTRRCAATLAAHRLAFSCKELIHRKTYRQFLRPVDEHGLGHFRLACQFERLEMRKHLFEKNAHFHLRKMLAKA